MERTTAWVSLAAGLVLTLVALSEPAPRSDPEPPPGVPDGDCILVGQNCGNKDFYCARQGPSAVCAVPPTPLPPDWPPSQWHDRNNDGCGCVY